ncbi:ribonuclease H family protein [Microbacterium halophytorum]|uniref:ribonuclease H family protein n=1 Tax=Microbacterium halophytorum TaxID=2067568 RepID=UPI000CFBC8F6|nr:ribonuclease H [Microbacterium halophytorum]
MTIIAAADGSALGNPGPMGWAWYIDDTSWAAGGAPHGTNNQGELTAVLELLRATKHTGEAMVVHCDSKYVIDSVTKWMRGWKRKGWRKADGKPVLNREIMEALDAELAGRDVRFEWVKGHAGHPLNEAADVRANGAAQAFQRRSPVAEGPGFAGGDERDGTEQPGSVADTAGSPGAGSALSDADAETPGPRRRSGTSAASAPATARTNTAPAPAGDDAAGPRRRGAAVRERVSLTDHAAGGAVGIAQPTLFDDIEQPAAVDNEIRITLTARESTRLRARAAEAGVSAEDFLRSLI